MARTRYREEPREKRGDSAQFQVRNAGFQMSHRETQVELEIVPDYDSVQHKTVASQAVSAPRLGADKR